MRRPAADGEGGAVRVIRCNRCGEPIPRTKRRLCLACIEAVEAAHEAERAGRCYAKADGHEARIERYRRRARYRKPLFD